VRPAEPTCEVLFNGVPISVSPGAVMTPGGPTVALVDVAVEWIGARAVRVADVGTGTGAVAVAVALRAPSARIWAIDDSETAVSVACANVARHHLEERVEVLLGNLLEPVPHQLELIEACRTRLAERGRLAIQLYGSILSAGREELDQLLREIETRAAAGWEARAAADAAGAAPTCVPWRATQRPVAVDLDEPRVPGPDAVSDLLQCDLV